MAFKQRTINQIAEMICGNLPGASFFVYRSSSFLTQFFQDVETDYVHDNSTRARWVAEVLNKIVAEPPAQPNMPSETFLRVVQRLMDKSDATNEDKNRENALKHLNESLSRDGYEAFYAEDSLCYLRHVATKSISTLAANPHRPFSPSEIKKREQLSSYLDKCSEDELIEEILIPLFRQIGFHRITAAGHKDKSLEYGKDIWMKYMLPTQHMLYFGIQVKKGKLDASGMPKASNVNVAEIHNQVSMMLGHEIFDPEIGKKVLVDHAYIVAGGEITKAAKNWIGGKLDTSKRSQIMFMDKEDILNLFIVTTLSLPAAALPTTSITFQVPDDDLPF